MKSKVLERACKTMLIAENEKKVEKFKNIILKSVGEIIKNMDLEDVAIIEKVFHEMREIKKQEEKE
jgi:hypothetical protein